MKTNRYIFLFVSAVSALLMLFSCKKSEIPYFDSTYNAVRFPKRDVNDKKNKEPHGYDFDEKLFKAGYSFVTTPDAPSFDYELPLELIGLVSDKDREVNFTIDKERSHVPDGSYEVLKAVIPAGKRSGMIVIRLFNKKSLREKSNTLFIKLDSSKDLAAGPVELIQGVLSWSARMPEPTHPTLWKTYNSLIEGHPEFNSESNEYFSFNALETIAKAMNWYDLNDITKHPEIGNGLRYGFYKYLPSFENIREDRRYEAYVLTLADYIEKYNKEHPDQPLLHDAGKSKGKPIKARKY